MNDIGSLLQDKLLIRITAAEVCDARDDAQGTKAGNIKKLYCYSLFKIS
jgi:hypothetical protein